jgi:hypothetical protein
MKVPSQDYALAGGLVCPVHEVDRGVWQEHVVKHPLGVQALAKSEGVAAWNQEGWDRLEPPAVTEGARAELVSLIAALSEGTLRCAVPELRGKKSGSDPERLACRDCQAPIVVRCEKLLHAPGGVGERYRSVTEDLLAGLTGDAGVAIAAEKFHAALRGMWRTPEKLAGAIVLTVGLENRRGARPIARISRYDGVRTELYFEEPDRLRWRTTYREFAKTRTGPLQISFLSDVPRPAPGLGRVSELCVVARRWWESHGN